MCNCIRYPSDRSSFADKMIGEKRKGKEDEKVRTKKLFFLLLCVIVKFPLL